LAIGEVTRLVADTRADLQDAPPEIAVEPIVQPAVVGLEARHPPQRFCADIVGRACSFRRRPFHLAHCAGAFHREYFRMVHTAWNASFRPIFLPSAYVRPLYEMGTS